MNLGQVDLNLLIYLDSLLRTKSVTRSANDLGITQPAMSNILKRLRDLFDDDILVRSSQGMSPTKFALELQSEVRTVVESMEEIIFREKKFDHKTSSDVFRIAVSDYVESTLIPPLLMYLRKEAPHVTLDLITPSDVNLSDLELGYVDMIINRFDSLPQSFYQKNLWNDHYVCVYNKTHVLNSELTMDSYLKADHIWVSKTGMGTGERMESSNAPRLGWVDKHMKKIGRRRTIGLFTRHYQSAILLAEKSDLVVTLPSRATRFCEANLNLVISKPPFEITPIEIKMAWSPKVHKDKRHRWLREIIAANANDPKPDAHYSSC